MAKKFVRGVTGIEDIESYDKTLTNVNDILSDGQDTFVHTKKGKTESYYKLTDSVKTINSTGSTITVSKDENGTVNLSTNPKKVLEHDNLLTDYGISKTTSGNTSKLSFEYTQTTEGFDLNNLQNGNVRTWKAVNAPRPNYWFFVSSFKAPSSTFVFQEATTFDNNVYKNYKRYFDGTNWSQWLEQVGDKSVIDGLLTQKQNTLTSNTSIAVLPDNSLRQLYVYKQTYTHTNGVLKTHVKTLSQNTQQTTVNEEFNFTVKINQNAQNIVVTLNDHDKTAFGKIMTAYGSNNTVRISGCVFTLSGSSLTLSTPNNTAQNYVMTFSDILD